MLHPGFDNSKYLEEQTQEILKRVEHFNKKLYLEFGGKLFFDHHASRVLPGYDPNVKVRLLHKLKDQAEIILCIHAGDIERRKIRADFGITYEMDALKLIDDLRSWDLDITGVVITRYKDQPAARMFKNNLELRNVRAYIHRPTPGYPTDVNAILSEEGFGCNAYVETKKPLVIVTGPGPGSGKLATCLSQIYNDGQRGIKSGYAKFETFPIWNLPLKHPVNVAYEAATADLKDLNIIDPFHLEAYGETAVNYNRDVEIFPVLKRILERVSAAESIYQSPTDMGVNCAGYGIIDDGIVQKASKQEIIRRYFWYRTEFVKGLEEKDCYSRVEMFMEDFKLAQVDRKPVLAARNVMKDKSKNGKDSKYGSAIELKNGEMATGKRSMLMNSSSSVILNAIKMIAGIPDNIHLLSPNVIESIQSLKRDILNDKNTRLNLEETLISLGISATTNPTAKLAMSCLKELNGCEMHTTHILASADDSALHKLGINVTSDPNFPSEDLYIG
ncbi:MAG: DUF1846 domain-containing protein [Clostridia bacterium]|nr:DUF1846 domain-containing protein [Clostridia bacterium]MDD4679525.1 DUF1846 domain-containing protein [Clostridia bacterium]